MKKTGSISDFTPQRDKELHAAFMDVLRNTQGVPLREMFGLAARRPASRFWVSETRAAIVISAMLQGKELPGMLTKRREMYEELLRRTKAKMAERPGLCMTHAVCEAVCEPAPEFYLTDESARSIIYRARQRRRHVATP